MEFKENPKQLRTQKGLTQAQPAEKLFVSRSTVAKWENGLGLPNPESKSKSGDAKLTSPLVFYSIMPKCDSPVLFLF